MVRVAGFEPTASWSRTMRATNCATPGYFIFRARPAKAGGAHTQQSAATNRIIEKIRPFVKGNVHTPPIIRIEYEKI